MRLHKLSRHLDHRDLRLLRLGSRLLWLGAAVAGLATGPRRLDDHANLVEALAGAFPLWPIRMGVAQPRSRQVPADEESAAGTASGLNPAEALVGNLAAEAAWRSTSPTLKGVGRLVEQLDRPVPQAAQFHH